jgi:hypothetical protein
MKIKAVDVDLGDVISLNGQEEQIHERTVRTDGSLLLNEHAFGPDDLVEVVSFADPKDEEREIMKPGAQVEHVRERGQALNWKI